jgi:hypothetical protein
LAIAWGGVVEGFGARQKLYGSVEADNSLMEI